ncbi:hypothetical protein F4774DRAFT_405193 [Daldinia eschscholtzii]|nr:hypothetical protein F4774DRAFT_405193 [Daldinia eschscholtzii]
MSYIKKWLAETKLVESSKGLQYLPQLIRYRIYWLYLDLREPLVLNVPETRSAGISRGMFYFGCPCPIVDTVRGRRLEGPIVDVNLAFTSKFFSKDVLSYLYGRTTLAFKCTCTFIYHISSNSELAANISRLKLYWSGCFSNYAFTMLQSIPLTQLEIVIGTFTTQYCSYPESAYRKHFKRWRTDLTHALGMSELLMLRGIRGVSVTCVDDRTLLLGDEDRYSLQALLREYLTEPVNKYLEAEVAPSRIRKKGLPKMNKLIALGGDDRP